MGSTPLNRKQFELLKLFADTLNDNKLMQTRKKVNTYFFRNAGEEASKMIQGKKYSQQMLDYMKKNN